MSPTQIGAIAARMLLEKPHVEAAELAEQAGVSFREALTALRDLLQVPLAVHAQNSPVDGRQRFSRGPRL